MSAGVRAFRKIQLTKESTPGTQVTPPTAQLIGTLGMQNDQKYYRPDDLETGKLSEYERSFIVGEQANLPFASDANYEQLGYLLGMSVIGAVTPTGPTDSLYVWTYKPNLVSLNAPDTYTFVYGDDVAQFISGFCFSPDIEISGTLDDAVKVKCNIVGQNVRLGPGFSALTPPIPLNPVIVGTGKLYIDNSWATLGDTYVPATLVDFSYKTVSKAGAGGINPIKYIDGNIFFSDRAEAKRHIELEMTLAFTSGTAGYFSSNFAVSPQIPLWIRLAFLGPLVGETSQAELDLDGCFIIDTFPTITERMGQDIVKLKLVSIYDPVGDGGNTDEWEIILKNGLATLP